jgi:hypothetical protein
MSRQEHRQPSMTILICPLDNITYHRKKIEGGTFVLLHFVEWIDPRGQYDPQTWQNRMFRASSLTLYIAQSSQVIFGARD